MAPKRAGIKHQQQLNVDQFTLLKKSHGQPWQADQCVWLLLASPHVVRITLYPCLTFLNPNTKKCHSCCSTADTSTAGSAARTGRVKRAKTGQDTVPYSALRPLDEALPGELDHEGWASEEDRDYRGYGWDYDSDWASPGESPPMGG